MPRNMASRRLGKLKKAVIMGSKGFLKQPTISKIEDSAANGAPVVKKRRM